MFKRIICAFKGHDYEILETILSSSKLECTRCKQWFGYNHDVNILLPWTLNFEFMHRDLKEKVSKEKVSKR